MSLTNGRTVNFADGSGCGQINPRLLGYLGNRLDNQQLHDQGLLAYNSLTAKPISLTHERADLFYFARLIRDWPDGTTDTAQSSNFDFYFRDIEAIVSRRRDISGRLWEFAAKGGHNDEAHNHNDCGSYLINIDGTPAVIEIGAPEYTREYFGPRRYQNIAARSLGHSVPLVNGIEQAPGLSFNSVVLKHEFGADKVTFSLDLSGCYPDEANIVRLERQFEFERTGIFGVTDLFELHAESENVETAIITSGRVTSLRNSVLIEIDEVTLTITPKPGARIANIVEYRYSDHEGHPASIRRIALRPVKRASSGELGYLLSIP